MEKATKGLGDRGLPFLASNDNVGQFRRPFGGGRAVEEGDSGDAGPDFEEIGNSYGHYLKITKKHKLSEDLRRESNKEQRNM